MQEKKTNMREQLKEKVKYLHDRLLKDESVMCLCVSANPLLKFYNIFKLGEQALFVLVGGGRVSLSMINLSTNTRWSPHTHTFRAIKLTTKHAQQLHQQPKGFCCLKSCVKGLIRALLHYIT